MRCLADGLVSQLSPSNASWDKHVAAWNLGNKLTSPFRLTLAFFLVLSNLLMLIGIWKTKDGKMSIPRKMFFSSGLCGLLTGLTFPFYTAGGLLENGCMYESVSDKILSFTVFLDFGKLISIETVRFVRLKWPLKRIVTGKTLLVIWFLEIIVTSVVAYFGEVVLLTDAQMSHMEMFRVYIEIFGITSGSCIFLTSILTSILWVNFRMELTTTNLSSNNPDIGVSAKRKNKAVNRLAAIALVYIVCNIPICVLCFVIFVSSEDKYAKEPMVFSINVILANWFYSLANLYSGLNSCIYMWMDRKIVAFYKSCFKKRVFSGTYDISATNNIV